MKPITSANGIDRPYDISSKYDINSMTLTTEIQMIIFEFTTIQFKLWIYLTWFWIDHKYLIMLIYLTVYHVESSRIVFVAQ